MTPDDAQAFADEWIAAWNAHDLDRILSHYVEEIVFLSRYAERLVGHGRVEGKPALRAYWGKALATRPDLRFEFDEVRCGFDCLTILYRNHRGEHAAETCEFDAQGQVVRSVACYR
jgi:ketosteroid isomerase-like protein